MQGGVVVHRQVIAFRAQLYQSADFIFIAGNNSAYQQSGGGLPRHRHIKAHKILQPAQHVRMRVLRAGEVVAGRQLLPQLHPSVRIHSHPCESAPTAPACQRSKFAVAPGFGVDGNRLIGRVGFGFLIADGHRDSGELPPVYFPQGLQGAQDVSRQAAPGGGQLPARPVAQRGDGFADVVGPGLQQRRAGGDILIRQNINIHPQNPRAQVAQVVLLAESEFAANAPQRGIFLAQIREKVQRGGRADFYGAVHFLRLQGQVGSADALRAGLETAGAIGAAGVGGRRQVRRVT